jgi:hypothetical protein
VRAVLDVLHQHRLFVKRPKCEFSADSISYLGHIISATGVAMDPAMVQAVTECPVPQSARAMHDFLGLAGYYHKFIKELGSVVVPLIALLHKEGFSWSAEAEAAFTAPKTVVTTVPVLTLPNFGQPFVIECDASMHGFCAVLLQG